MFSKACQYAIRASIYIAEQSLNHAAKVSLKEVSKAIDSPEAYTSKILQELARHNILQSVKGPKGGFFMSNEGLDKTKLSTIVFAIDGDAIYTGCGLGLKKCNSKLPCPVHNEFKLIRDELKKMLENTLAKSLTLDLAEGLTFLKR